MICDCRAWSSCEFFVGVGHFGRRAFQLVGHLLATCWAVAQPVGAHHHGVKVNGGLSRPGEAAMLSTINTTMR